MKKKSAKTGLRVADGDLRRSANRRLAGAGGAVSPKIRIAGLCLSGIWTQSFPSRSTADLRERPERACLHPTAGKASVGSRRG